MKGYQSFSDTIRMTQGQLNICCVRERKVEE